MAEYLQAHISEVKRTKTTPLYGMTRAGYTKLSGAPLNVMVRLEGEKRWRRLMCWQFSNAGMCFLRVKGKDLVVSDYKLPMSSEIPSDGSPLIIKKEGSK